jgi:hypothetical protein
MSAFAFFVFPVKYPAPPFSETMNLENETLLLVPDNSDGLVCAQINVEEKTSAKRIGKENNFRIISIGLVISYKETKLYLLYNDLLVYQLCIAKKRG